MVSHRASMLETLIFTDFKNRPCVR